MAELLPARVQMALTLGFHIVFACLGVGLPALMLFAEWRALRTGLPGWKTLARRWSKAFAVLFAVGAVSGTVLSFELGLLWPAFMGTYGAVIGLPFTLEAFAFFLEAIFVGIYLYTWDRLSPRAHFWSGVPIAIAGLASAAFVVTANAWMNTPQGFRLEGGRVVDADPLRAMMNPAAAAQMVHMIVAAYLVTGFAVAAFYAAARLRGADSTHHRRAMAAGLVMGVVAAPLQFVTGDWAAKTVARTQPVKFAAMEGQESTQRRAPLRIGPLEIPGGLSWLAHGDADAEVKGLDAVPREDRPPADVVHAAFQIMVAAGSALVALAAWVSISAWRRKTIPAGRAFLLSVAAAGPLAVVALEAGWVVTEVGRQPWIVQGLMKTSDAVTTAPGVAWSLAIVTGIYGVLTTGAIFVLRLLARAPLKEGDGGA